MTVAGYDIPRTAMTSARVFCRAVAWELLLQVRYQIVTVAAVVTVLYCVLLRLAPESARETLTVVIIFSDPTTLGFVFVGVLVLFERGAGTLQAVIVSPLSAVQYVWAKAASLTIIVVLCSVVIGAVSRGGFDFNVLMLVLGTGLTSVMLVFIGFIGAVRARSLNAYLIITPLFMIPLMLPMAPYLWFTWFPPFYLLPTSGSVFVIDAAMTGTVKWEAVYGVCILLAGIAVAQRVALNSFENYVRKVGG